MKKFFSFIFVALFSVSMLGNTYYYTGNGNDVGWSNQAAMTPSTDGFYEYYLVTSSTTHQFKIGTSANMYAYNYTYIRAGFNSTNISTISDYGSDNCYLYDVNATHYILVYYPYTTVNPSANPIICASTELPNNPKFYITGNKALTGDDGDWNTKKFAATENSYTFNLHAGEYLLAVLNTGNWSEGSMRYDQLTDKSDAGLMAGNDNNISFRLTADASVTVTYTVSELATVFTVEATTGEFFSIDNGFYYFEEGQQVYELDKKFVVNAGSEYKLSTTLTEGAKIKVVKVESNAITTGYPKAVDAFYTVDASHAGTVTIYFQEDYKDDWSAFGGYFYVAKESGTALDNTADEAKAIKRIENGQLVIYKNGVRYNALGAEIK